MPVSARLPSPKGRPTAAGSSCPAFDQRKETELVMLRLPVPVSVNDLHAPRAGGGVRRSDAYNAWLKEAGTRLDLQQPGRIGSRYSLVLMLPRSSGLDLDNAIKAISDLLQLHGVIRNDRDAEDIRLCRQDETEQVIVKVRIFAGGVRS